MIRNYLKTALRNILRSRLTSFINIAGLALALTSALMIYLFISDELSYDRYHAKADRTYRVARTFYNRDGGANLRLSTLAPPFGPLLQNDFGEIEELGRTLQFNVVMSIEENGVRSKIANEPQAFVAEPSILRIFDIHVVKGNPEHALDRPFTVLLSEKAAQKYFGSDDPIGRHLNSDSKLELEVTGIFEEFPSVSHWHPDFLISFSTLNDDKVYGRRNLETNYGNNSFNTYIVLSPGTDPAKLETQFPAFIDKHYGTYAKANYGVPPTFIASKTTSLGLQPLTDIHLRSHYDNEIEVGGDINNVYLMGMIGVFIILIACFNFINLSTAQATRRSKEVGLRKALGAFRQQLIGQYLSESTLLALFGWVLAVAIAFTLLPWLNSFTGKQLALAWTDWKLLAGMTLVTLVIGATAGLYPAVVLSGFRPATVLKGGKGDTPQKSRLRQALVVGQFWISIVLLIATATVAQQLNFLNKQDLGFERDQVVTLPFYTEADQSLDAFTNALKSHSSVHAVGLSSRIPTGRLLDSQGGVQYMVGDSLLSNPGDVKNIAVDEGFFETYGIEMAAGRNFSRSVPTDDSLGFIVNEATVRMLGWKNNAEGIDKEFGYGGVKGKLIGVVKDFHFESLHEGIIPMIFVVSRDNYNFMSVKLAGSDTQAGISHLEMVWKEFLPNRPFDYTFVSQRYQQLYEREQKQGTLFSVFSGMAVFIACLGLFGLATFNTLQRTKEIGIRKVMGASVPNILLLLSRETVILIVVANLLAWPCAWYGMNLWLSTFAYHVELNVWLFASAALAAFAIAILTVSSQTIRAAVSNPSHTLRYE